jgi:hypothetical protein
MALVRNYSGGTGPDYIPSNAHISANYYVAGADDFVAGTFDTKGLLTADQIDQLVDAMQKACAGLPWVVNLSVSASDTGSRSWTITDTP